MRASPSQTDRPFGCPPDPIIVVLDLPVPPSVNRTRRINWRHERKSEAWRRAADGLVMAAKRKPRRQTIHKVAGRFELLIVMSEDHTSIDLDNGVKWTIDYLKRIELITDDSPKYMRRLVVEWGHAPEGCRLTLTEIP